MAQVRRKGRMLKWAGLAISSLIIVAWAASILAIIEYRYPDRVPTVILSSWPTSYVSDALILSEGRLVAGNVIMTGVPSGWQVHAQWSGTSFRASSNGRLLTLPLWIPFLIVAIHTVFLWRRGRRPLPPGHCQKCGYNLTGNVSGVCPECGVRIQADRIEKGRSDNSDQA